jgi:hypothetical protein
MRKGDKMTKEELITAIRNSGCKLMTGLPLIAMSREAIIVHLTHCNCPILRRLIKDDKI